MIKRDTLGVTFLAQNGWGGATRTFLQGDASSRKYERLTLGKKSALFVDSPQKKDGPIIRGDNTYSEIAHLAESVTPFIAMAQVLKSHGLSAPEIYAVDYENGFLLLEDLGGGVYGDKIKKGDDMDAPYREAVQVLLKLAELPTEKDIDLPNGSSYHIPDFDEQAFLIEAELFTDWFWKWLGIELPGGAGDSLNGLWAEMFAQLQNCPEKPVLALRDYHSPNLIWCEEREGKKRAGLIDFQDAVYTHPAYDLVSLLQDARTDIPTEVEDEYKSLYLKKRAEKSSKFDREQFEFAYYLLGAQRNTKILGIFARLALRDNKPDYLFHIPRVIAYLEKCLAASGLESLKAWFDTFLPDELRREISVQLSKAEVGKYAIVLSAGLGKRMAPLSDNCPKPLIKVLGKPLLEYALEKLSDIHVGNIVVNVHYLADQIENYLDAEWRGDETLCNITISDERAELLETGGGIKKALPHLGRSAFFVLNSDSIWLEGDNSHLLRLIEAWDDEKMDCLILLAERASARGFSGKGDFEMGKDGLLQRRRKDTAPYVVSGTYLVHPRLFETAPEGPFSMNLLWDKAIGQNRLYGIKLEGDWLHIGTPEAVEDSEKYISERESGLS